MKKILVFVLGIASLFIIFCTNTFAVNNQLFLCMKANSSMAYRAINDELLDYVQMKDSSGAIATAKIIDGSTYLPFRYIAENAGLADAVDSNMGNNTFKYESIGTGSITIVTKKGRFSQNINVPFTFKLDNGEEIEYKIMNIDGSLYFPMRYMAYLVGGEVDWSQSTGNIYFMSNENVAKDFLTGKEGNKVIKYSKMAYLNYSEYDNTLGYSDIYLESDGKTVSSVIDEIDNGHSYYSVTRSRRNIYFVDENYKACCKKEVEKTLSTITFYNTKNERIDPTVLNIISHQNTLYGIERTGSSNSGVGRVFKSDLDGENYHYISNSSNAYNILLREYQGQSYIFYVDATEDSGDNKEIHRINLSTGEDDIIYINDYNGNSLINRINIMSLNDNTVVISEYNNPCIDIITLDNSIYTNNYITGSLTGKITSLNKLTDIVKVSSLNYDTDNNLIYFINNTGKGYGLYCCDPLTSKVYSISTSQDVKRRISIIKMSDSIYRVYHYTDATKNLYKYDLVSVSDNGNIKIGSNINIERN